MHCCYEHLCKAQGPSCLHPHTALELESHPFVPFAWIQAPEENEYDKAMAELKKIVSNEQYELLLQLSED